MENNLLNKSNHLIVDWADRDYAVIRKDLWDKLKGLDNTFLIWGI